MGANMKCLRALYRKYYDFPFKWKPYGWEKEEMRKRYWAGVR